MLLRQPTQHPGLVEFIALMALLTAIEALSIDAMLPALGEIGLELGATGNEPQLIVSMLFLGAAIGQFFSGALSDSFGRRRAVLSFGLLYLVGTAVCILASDFSQMIAGRLLQGFGAAGPYIVAVAIIRDRYEGRGMARIMSFTMSVFIMVPIIAPMLGQGVLLFAEWRAIFYGFAVLSSVVLIWFALRQPETLAPAARVPVSLVGYARSARAVMSARPLVIYTAIQGLILGSFIGYLSGAQPIFQDVYEQGALFPVIFAVLAVAVGVASAVNGALVMRIGMRRLAATALAVLVVLSVLFLIWASSYEDRPPFSGVLIWLMASLFCFGLMFGNIGAIALEPLGAQAGMGATMFGGVSTLLAVAIGSYVGHSFDGTVVPLALGFAICPFLALLLMFLDGGSPWRDRSGV
jgi:DHA1 family bicyclomycin/chloramphenicol resistance-like MFS transporter